MAKIDTKRPGIRRWTWPRDGAAAPSTPLAIRPALLGFGPLIAASLAYPSTYIACLGLDDGGNALGLFVFGALLFGLASGALRVGASVRGRRLPLWGRGAGALLFTAGTLGFLVARQASCLAPPLALLLGAAAGFGGLSVYEMWGRLYARLGLRGALLNVALSVVLASLLNWMLFAVSEETFMLLFPCVLMAGVWTPFLAWAQAPTAQGEQREAGWKGSRYPRVDADKLRSAAGLLFAPLLGLMVFGFVGSLLDAQVIARAYGEQILGYVLGAALTAALLLIPSRKPLYPFAYQVMLPLLAVGVLAARVLVGEGFAGASLFDIGLHIMFGAVIVISFATIAAMGHADELPVSFIVACAYGLYTLFALVGRGARFALEGVDVDPAGLALGVWIAYFCMQALYPSVAQWLSDYRNLEAPPVLSISEALTERCGDLASRYGLTQREAEICRFLGRGHSSQYVSQVLLISDSTVRTHIKNIYRKMGVVCREELIALIDGEPLPAGGPVAEGDRTGRKV